MPKLFWLPTGGSISEHIKAVVDEEFDKIIAYLQSIGEESQSATLAIFLDHNIDQPNFLCPTETEVLLLEWKKDEGVMEGVNDTETVEKLDERVEGVMEGVNDNKTVEKLDERVEGGNDTCRVEGVNDTKTVEKLDERVEEGNDTCRVEGVIKEAMEGVNEPVDGLVEDWPAWEENVGDMAWTTEKDAHMFDADWLQSFVAEEVNEAPSSVPHNEAPARPAAAAKNAKRKKKQKAPPRGKVSVTEKGKRKVSKWAHLCTRRDITENVDEEEHSSSGEEDEDYTNEMDYFSDVNDEELLQARNKIRENHRAKRERMERAQNASVIGDEESKPVPVGEDVLEPVPVDSLEPVKYDPRNPNPAFVVGMIFKNAPEFREAIRKYAVNRGVEIKMVKMNQ
ncbi:uncharacterized protein LOC126686346 [Mercurialis annua]|uniref:uncharacterized protein LOC126686346 n=1 Tax=Mercurialis annua TaxID=3986 RepID=UPI00215E9B06|nr:uncharacterized protein LOC126686346 [Mercurialis annua]